MTTLCVAYPCEAQPKVGDVTDLLRRKISTDLVDYVDQGSPTFLKATLNGTE